MSDILDLWHSRLNRMLPCDVIRLGDRQYDVVRAWFDDVVAARYGFPAGSTPEQILGMRLEHVESPDYLVIE